MLTARRRYPALTDEPAFKVVLPNYIDDIDDFQPYGGVLGPVFSSGLALPQMLPYQPLPAQNLLAAAPMPHPIALPPQPLFPPPSLDLNSLQQQQQQSWDMFMAAAASEPGSMDAPADPALDLGPRWPQLDMLSSFAAELRTTGNTTTAAGVPLHMASACPERIFGMGQPPAQPALTALHFVPPANSACGDAAPLCDSSTSLSLHHLHHLHHEVLDDAFYILRARRAAADDNPDDALYAWLRVLTWTAPGDRREPLLRPHSRRASVGSSHSSRSSHSGSVYDADDGLAAKLLQLFRSSLDGRAGLLYPRMLALVPCCLELPLLVQAAVHTSACFLHDAGYIDELADGVHSDRAAQMLRVQLSPGDKAMAAGTQLVMDAWYGGQTADLSTHLHGLHEMARLRGGLTTLDTSLVGRLAMA